MAQSPVLWLSDLTGYLELTARHNNTWLPQHTNLLQRGLQFGALSKMRLACSCASVHGVSEVTSRVVRLCVVRACFCCAGWDEILEGGLAEGATVMSWRVSGGLCEEAVCGVHTWWLV